MLGMENNTRSVSGRTVALKLTNRHMKKTPKYSYEHVIGNSTQHSYSLEAANFIVGEIKKNPERIITDIKKANKKR